MKMLEQNAGKKMNLWPQNKHCRHPTQRCRVPAGFFSFEFVFVDARAEEYEAVEFSDATTTLSFPEEVVPVFFAFGRRAGRDTRFVVFLAFSSTNVSASFISFSLSSSRW